jgi:hypothetical protein
MKKIIVIAVMLLSAIGAFAQDGKSIYQKYSDEKDVSAVYISPAMFRLMGKIPDLKVEDSDINLGPIIKSLSGLYIIDSTNPIVNDTLKGEVDSLVKAGRYEMLMEAKESGETVRMYTLGTEAIVNSFVMLSLADDEVSFICFDGKMNRDDLEKLLAEKMTD